MKSINYYQITADFNSGEVLSAETNSTSVIFLPRYLENSTNASYIISIVVFNSEGMSSPRASRSFGMKIHIT